MFGLGMPELILILIIVLVLFGAKNLPDIGKAFGKTIHEFRKATTEEPDKKDEGKKEDPPSEKEPGTKK